MAKNRMRKFTQVFEVETFLNGGLIAGPVPMAQDGGSQAGGQAQGYDGLVGKTLKFSSPGAATVTFVASSGAGGSADPALPANTGNPNPQVLLFKDIKLQVEAAVPAIKVLNMNGKLVFIEATPTSGVTIDHTGTATALVGFDGAHDTVGKVYAPPPSATPPCWTWAYSGNDNMHAIFTLE